MFKETFFIGFLVLTFAFNANADDSDRIDQLEKEVRELKNRVSEIESKFSNMSEAQNDEISGEGWKSLANWRKLRNGMDENDVQKLLGEPYRIDGGIAAKWFYQNNSFVQFYNGEIRRWQEPR